jgi:putative transposase
MLLTYQYKLKPAKEQKAVMLQWLELLRRHYNYALAQRLDWLKRTRCSIDRCSLISEPIGEIPEKFPNYNVQAGELKLSKELFPAYKDIYHVYGKALLSLGRQQRFLKRKEKGSKRHQKQQNFIARIHQRIGRQRKDFHYNVAHGLVKTYDLIAVEDLNIRGLARTKLAKSILDAAWGQFITILETVAVKCGVRVVKVKPHGTSQDCSSCGTKVPKTLSIRTHSCPKCGCCLDRDENAAINILNRALTEVGLILASQCRLGETPSGASGAARGGFEDTQPVKRELLGMKGTQLSLF